MTVTEFEAMLQAGQFGAVASVERDAAYALGEHSHPFDACALVTSGDITLVVGGVSTTYHAGEIFRLPAGAPHEEFAGTHGVGYRVGRRVVASV
jgi:quercetin dioxygenase-like cupin family protein